jgi:hypothetical protein
MKRCGSDKLGNPEEVVHELESGRMVLLPDSAKRGAHCLLLLRALFSALAIKDRFLRILLMIFFWSLGIILTASADEQYLQAL